MLTVADVDAFLNAPKTAVSAMDWRPGLSKKDVQWLDWYCAVEISGVVPEGARIIVQYRPIVGAASEKLNCGLFFRNERVFAIDFNLDTQHSNKKAGQGRAYFGKRFGPGTHEHTWSEEGYGYAEPIQDFVDYTALFAYFCTKTTLQVEGGFRRPPSQQLSLGLI